MSPHPRDTRPEIWLFDDAPIHGGAELFALRLARFVAGLDGWPRMRIVCPAGTELASATAAAGARHEDASLPAPSLRSVPRWPGL